MENHPIPQDVTGFKFKLIGSLTVKQFLYLLGTGVICGLFFILPIPALLKWPLILLLAGGGAALAFLPIEGRPMDVMLVNFAKAIPAENKFIFHKKGAEKLLHNFFDQKPTTPRVEKNANQPSSNQRKELLMSHLSRKSSRRPDPDEQESISSITGLFNEETPAGMTSVESLANSQPRPSMVVRPPVDMPEQPTSQSDVRPIAPVTPPQAEASQIPNNTTETIQSTQTEIPEPPSPPQEPTPEISTPPQQSQEVRVVTPETQVASGFPQIPDTPNVILGIVKDARGKVLPNIIVEVVDQNGIPVRAFKTNALGQFAAATPLSSGKYKILLEDSRHIHEFSPIEVELAGEIFQPLEIISIDSRERLRQELFGARPTA